MQSHARPRIGASSRRFGKAAINTLIAFTLLVVGCVVSATPAYAAEFPVGEWGTYKGGETFWGSMTVNGRYGLCIDPVLHAPVELDDSTATKVCGTFENSKAQAFTNTTLPLYFEV